MAIEGQGLLLPFSYTSGVLAPAPVATMKQIRLALLDYRRASPAQIWCGRLMERTRMVRLVLSRVISLFISI